MQIATMAVSKRQKKAPTVDQGVTGSNPVSGANQINHLGWRPLQLAPQGFHWGATLMKVERPRWSPCRSETSRTPFHSFISILLLSQNEHDTRLLPDVPVTSAS